MPEMPLGDLTNMINSVMGQNVLTEKQLGKIMEGAKKRHEEGGLPAVVDYLMKVTQADVDKNELQDFAENIKQNPSLGLEFLQGKKKIDRKKK